MLVDFAVVSISIALGMVASGAFRLDIDQTGHINTKASPLKLAAPICCCRKSDSCASGEEHVQDAQKELWCCQVRDGGHCGGVYATPIQNVRPPQSYSSETCKKQSGVGGGGIATTTSAPNDAEAVLWKYYSQLMSHVERGIQTIYQSEYPAYIYNFFIRGPGFKATSDIRTDSSTVMHKNSTMCPPTMRIKPTGSLLNLRVRMSQRSPDEVLNQLKSGCVQVNLWMELWSEGEPVQTKNPVFGFVVGDEWRTYIIPQGAAPVVFLFKSDVLEHGASTDLYPKALPGRVSIELRVLVTPGPQRPLLSVVPALIDASAWGTECSKWQHCKGDKTCVQGTCVDLKPALIAEPIGDRNEIYQELEGSLYAIVDSNVVGMTQYQKGELLSLCGRAPKPWIQDTQYVQYGNQHVHNNSRVAVRNELAENPPIEAGAK